MKPFEQLYWSYFTFYQKVMKDDTPHLLTTLALSTSEAMLLIALADYAMASIWCTSITKKAMLGLTLLAIFINYWHFHRNSHWRRVMENPPSHPAVTHSGAALFFILSFFMFLEVPGSVYKILQKCR